MNYPSGEPVMINEQKDRWLWQRVLFEALILEQLVDILEDIRKHCDCPYIDQKLKELKQYMEYIRQKSGL